MAVLTLSPHPHPRSSKLVLTKALADGRLVHQGQLDPFDPASQRAGALACEVDPQTIARL